VAVLLVEQQARRALAVADRWYLLAGGEVVDRGDKTAAADALEVAYLASMTGGRNGQADRTNHRADAFAASQD
jgi:branched-chain amino acid transport system ATP-binding protein